MKTMALIEGRVTARALVGHIVARTLSTPGRASKRKRKKEGDTEIIV
jgi:hypothetical protein